MADPLLESILTSISDAVLVTDLKGEVFHRNPAAEDLALGRRDNGENGFGVYRIDRVTPVPAGDIPLFRTIRGEHVDNEELYVENDRIPGGMYVSVSGGPLRSANGAITGGVVVCRDITLRKKVEIELADANTFMRRAQEAAHIGVFTAPANITEANGWWSDEACRIHGVAPGTTPTIRLYFSLVHPDDRDAVKAAVEKTVSGATPFESEHRIVRPDGKVRWVHERGEAEVDHEGKVRRIVGTIQDVTERRRLVAELQQAQKLEAIGRLAGGVAHDFNNILTAIQGYCAVLVEGRPPRDPVVEDVGEIQRAAGRAADLTRQLLAFGRRQVLQPRVINPNDVVGEMENMLRRLMGAEIRFEVNLDAALRNVRADRSQLEQVVMNLVINARDAMPGGGRLTIRTANVFRPGHPDVVMLEISDTGAGMDRATKERVFEPFFTTKEFGKGTGLGLATVYGIVSQSGGRISLESEPNRGSSFQVYLPAANEAPAPAPAARPSVARSGRGTVLLVEDEEIVRRLARRVLLAQGYVVLDAPDGQEALRLAGLEAEGIDALVTDISMPRMNGRELARRLRERRPGLPVVYMTGYSDDALENVGAESGSILLEKPYSPDGLVLSVREALAAENARKGAS